jgi:hypothetical protein
MKKQTYPRHKGLISKLSLITLVFVIVSVSVKQYQAESNKSMPQVASKIVAK